MKELLIKVLSLIPPKKTKFIESLLEHQIHMIIQSLYFEEYQLSSMLGIIGNPLKPQSKAELYYLHHYPGVFMGFKSRNKISEDNLKLYMTHINKSCNMIREIRYYKYKGYLMIKPEKYFRVFILYVDIKFKYVSFSNSDRKKIWNLINKSGFTKQEFIDFGDVIPKELIVNMYDMPKKYYDVKFSYYYA